MRALLAAGLVSLVVPTGALAWTDLGPVQLPVAGDGERFAVQPVSRRELLIHDDLRPDAPRRIDVGPQCQFGGQVGSGRAMLSCEEGFYTLPQPVVLDLATMAARRVPSLARIGQQAMDYAPTGVGRRWVEVAVNGYHWSLRRYIRVSDGAIRKVDSGRAVPDLDALNVRRSLCSPLRRPRSMDENGFENLPRHGTAHWSGAWMVYRRPFAYRGGAPRRHDLRAWRCGRRHSVRLGTCRVVRCGEPVTMRNLAVWSHGTTLRAATLRPLRRRRVATPGGTPYPAASGSRLFLTVETPAGLRAYVR